jgi:hypothetical protein
MQYVYNQLKVDTYPGRVAQSALSRRQLLAHALVTAGAAVLPIALPASTPSRASAVSFSDSIYFGNDQSEQAKAFTTTNSTVVTNSLGLTGGVWTRRGFVHLHPGLRPCGTTVSDAQNLGIGWRQ